MIDIADEIFRMSAAASAQHRVQGDRLNARPLAEGVKALQGLEDFLARLLVLGGWFLLGRLLRRLLGSLLGRLLRNLPGKLFRRFLRRLPGRIFWIWFGLVGLLGGRRLRSFVRDALFFLRRTADREVVVGVLRLLGFPVLSVLLVLGIEPEDRSEYAEQHAGGKTQQPAEGKARSRRRRPLRE
jgi:hypothetical protein